MIGTEQSSVGSGEGATSDLVPGLALSLATGYVLLVGVQLPIAGVNVGLGDLLVPALFLALGASLAPARAPRFSGVLFVGLAITAFLFGTPTQYVWAQKVFGWGFLAVTAMLLATVVADRRVLARLIDAFMRGGLVLTVVGLAAYVLTLVVGLSIPFLNFGERLSSTMPDPNAFGSFLVALLAIDLGSDWSRSRYGALLSGLVRLLLLTALVLTFSRTAWGGFVSVVAVLTVVRTRSLLRQGLVAVFAAIVAFRLLSVGAVEQGVVLATRARQVQSRLDIVSAAWTEFRSSPLVGIGIGNFPARHEYIVHNSPAWFAVNLGIVGLVFGAAFLLSPIMQAFAVRRSQGSPDASPALGLGLALIGMGVCSLGIEALYQRHWWVLMALARGAYLLEQTSTEEAVDNRRVVRTPKLEVGKK